MRVRVGTSGYSYPAWRGTFYPEGLKEAGMLRFYAERLPTVEINNTFYRMPSAAVLERWSGETPEGFSFVLKASQRITHMKRLNDADSLAYFLKTAEVLGSKLGPILFQLPPFFKKDLPRLQQFLGLLPAGRRAAFEFRHESWAGADVQDALRAAGAALCLADTDEEPADEALVTTADWGYLRLRRTDYDAAALARWAERIQAQPWSEAWVFFKHEDEGKGAAFATALIERLGPGRGPDGAGAQGS
jgi:uncharacterized protein YecE (DUF72 family)